MIPVCRSMDSSYPYQRNQSPYPPFYYPGFEPNLPQMNMNPPKSPFPYEHPWSHGGCCGHYPNPTNFCCAHNNNFHGYYNYRPQHYHHHHAPFPSPPMYYSGGYQEPFFVPYAPQPHYTMELPRYDYEKHMPRDYHCCGCPNHPGHQKEEQSVKIEEEEPDNNAGNKVNNDEALAPIQTRNYPYPYPVVWIPPEYTRTRNKEAKSGSIAEAKGEQDQISHDRKPSSPMNFQEPRIWNGWVPFDMNHTPNKVLEGDGRRNKNLGSESNERVYDDGKGMNNKNQSENQRSEFPFPIFWVPYYNKQEEDGKGNNQESHSSPKCIEEVPHTFKSVPVNSKADEIVRNGTMSNPVESIDRSGSDETKDVTNEKIIPVKEVELHQGRNNSNENAKRERIIPVKQIEENVAKKESHAGMEKQSASPRKNGKLPPVCLRVDPPRKKNGKSSNGSSRSPSPPASKEHSKAASEAPSEAQSAGVSDKVQLYSDVKSVPNISEVVKPKEQNVPVSEGKSNEKPQPDSSLLTAPDVSKEVHPKEETIQVTENKTNGDKGADENCSVGDTEENKAQNGAENIMEEASKPNEAKDSSKPTGKGGNEKKALSDVDAAILIQAVYRGYQVRRSEPLKKLKQIAEVSKELTNVKASVQAFEHSSDLQNDEKQRIALGENIMRLLLKLDTIQGLHPSFRETRKSLARELTCLQERLDSVMAKRSQQQTKEFIDKKPVEDISENLQNEEHVKDQQEEKAAVAREDSSVGINDDMMGKDRIEFQPPLDPASNVVAEPNVAPNEAVDECNHTSDLSVEFEARSEVGNTPTGIKNSDTNALQELPVGVIDEDGADCSSKNEEQNEKAKEDSSGIYGLKELPMGVLDENPAELVKDDGETKLGDVESIVELPVGVLDEDNAASEFNKDDGTKFSKREPDHEEEVEAIVELPVGLLDEDTAASESKENDDGTKISKAQQQQHEDLEPIMELPVGLLDEEETIEFESVKHDKHMEHITELPVGLLDEEEKIKSEPVKRDAAEKVPPVIEEQCSVAAKDTQLEPEQQMEEQEEVQSSEESSDGGVKVEFSKDEELKGDAQRDIDIAVECEEETGNEAELPTVESAKRAAELRAAELVSDSNREEEYKKKLTQLEEQTESEEKLAAQVTSVNNEDTALLSKEVDQVAEHNGMLKNGDAELLEENEKLRNMMNRLLDAGNEQLKVISDLTERVKDLEKRLARSKKRMRTKWFKPASSFSNLSSKNNLLKHTAIDVAM